MTTKKAIKTGDLTGAAGTRFEGMMVQPDMSLGGSNKPRPGTLVAEIDVTAATASLAVYLKWEASEDPAFGTGNVVDLGYDANNPAAVALVTGTAAAIKKGMRAPDSVYAYPYCRAVLYTAGATGGASDVCSIAYRWQTPIAYP